jgi:hypothetical protein
MPKKINSVISDNTITVNFDGQTHMLSRTDAYAERVLQALRDRNYDEIPNLVSAAKRIETFSKGTFQVRDGEILVDGQPAPPVVGRKIKEFADEGLPYEPLVKFVQNLRNNPSFRAVNELYGFLEKNNHPITEDGTIIMYKAVKADFTDVHTGTFDNRPGQVLEMPRNQVNEDPNVHCSNGFHCGNWRYCNEFYSGGNMLEVEVNPADVVSIPNDLNEKVRVCKYKVLGVVKAELSSPLREVHTETPSDAGSDFSDENEDYCLDCGGDYDTYGDCECENVYDTCEDNACPSCYPVEGSVYGKTDFADDEDVYPYEDELTDE